MRYGEIFMEKEDTKMNEVKGYLRDFRINIPRAIYESKGIKIFGRRIKSIVFSTDVSIIRNCNADAVIAVYPFTPQPVITQAVMIAADCPVFVGVGGGLTKGERVINLARHAEYQGATGIVVNAPTPDRTLHELAKVIDLPIVVTVVRDDDNIASRLKAGAQILNVSAAARTPELVKKIRKEFPDVPIMATGGPTEETIRATITAGADAITWTPPSNGEVFRDIMEAYRKGEPHP